MLRGTTSLVAATLGLAGGCGAGHGALEPGPEAAPPDVVPITVRRLNRAEYDNTVRDLLGTTRRPARDFPADERGHGFDNIATLLDVSPELGALYERAAFELAEAALSDPDQRARLVPCDGALDPDDCAARVVASLGPRAFRRPLTPNEHTALLELYATLRADGDGFDAAMVGVVASMLMSPHFLFRVERDPEPAGSASHMVSGYELASRLSYFLWSSMPDAELFEAAARDQLQTDEEIELQVERMLDDSRAQALVDDFAGQWLYIRALDDMFKDPVHFPYFDEDVRVAMKHELEHAFASLIADDGDPRDLLVGRTTMIERPLAGIYGVATAPFEGAMELRLDALPRRGILTSPGLMAVLARPFRTAPVKRGAWVLSQLLCEPPAPPPAGVEGFAEVDGPLTLRERLEQHRADPSCAGCHDRLDPLGLAFEHYDGIGAWRAEDAGAPVDASGMLPGGESFRDAVDLAELLAADPAFLDCVVRKTMTYALGRGLTTRDRPHVDAIVEALEERGASARALFVLIAQSPPFRFRAPQEDR